MENSTVAAIDGISNNTNATTRVPLGFSDEFRIVATLLHVTIFVIGFVGNITVVIVVKRTRSMHTPTYCYLVSLAVADLLVLVSAMPEQIVSHHLYAGQWIFGHFGCSLLIFMNFLGINASSTSILCFTVERYIGKKSRIRNKYTNYTDVPVIFICSYFLPIILKSVGICHPLLAQKVCSVERAKKIILFVWFFAVIYCCPWLGLTTIRIMEFDGGYPQQELCTFRLDREYYVYFFMTDLVLFYVLPLMVSIILYARIGIILHRSTKNNLGKSRRVRVIHEKPRNGEAKLLVRSTSNRDKGGQSQDQARIQVVRMLVIIVTSFALLWLPYRGLLVYNSFAVPWRNIWYLLFAKTLIYINSAMNPVLYNAMSKRFRIEFMRVIFCMKRSENKALSVSDATTTTATLVVPSTRFRKVPSDASMTSVRRTSPSNAELILGSTSAPLTPYPSANFFSKVGKRLRSQEMFQNGIDSKDNLSPLYEARADLFINSESTVAEL